jgi:hypothetical protein
MSALVSEQVARRARAGHYWLRPLTDRMILRTLSSGPQRLSSIFMPALYGDVHCPLAIVLR